MLSYRAEVEAQALKSLLRTMRNKHRNATWQKKQEAAAAYAEVIQILEKRIATREGYANVR